MAASELDPGASGVSGTQNDAQDSTSESQVSTILLGLSGPSSSGKTTLARLLRSIFDISTPSSRPTQPSRALSLFILHQDDFYLTDALVPVITASSKEFGTRDLQDWDCVESLDLPLFEDTLRHVKAHGRLPEGSVSKEDQNAIGESGVSEVEIEKWKAAVQTWFNGLLGEGDGDGEGATSQSPRKEIQICILDGFLLYSSPSSSSQELNQLHTLTQTLLSPRLFLPTTRAQTLARRLRRSGYVTLEGFWTDPPGYVQDVVWPNYVRDHGWMYRDGRVDDAPQGSADGSVVFNEDLLKREDIQVCPGGGTWEMKQVLAWAVERVKEAVVQKVGAEAR